LREEIAADEDWVVGGVGFDVDRAHFRVQGTGYRALSSGACPRRPKEGLSRLPVRLSGDCFFDSQFVRIP
jgi:hypothetical protein